MNCRLLLPASSFTSCAVVLRKTIFPGQGKELIHEPNFQGRKCLWMETGLHVPVCCTSRLLAALLGEGQEESYRRRRWRVQATPEAGAVALLNPPLSEDWDIHSAAKISWWFTRRSNYSQQYHQGCSCSSQPWTWAAGARPLASSFHGCVGSRAG